MARRCGYCGQQGHNKRTCSDRLLGLDASRVDSAPKKSASASRRKCSYCANRGHNRRTCPTLKADYTAFTAASCKMQDEVHALCIESGFGVGSLITWRKKNWYAGDARYVAVVTGIAWEHVNMLRGDDPTDWLNYGHGSDNSTPVKVKILAIQNMDPELDDYKRERQQQAQFTTINVPLPWHLWSEETWNRLSPRGWRAGQFGQVVNSDEDCDRLWYSVECADGDLPKPSHKVRDAAVACPKPDQPANNYWGSDDSRVAYLREGNDSNHPYFAERSNTWMPKEAKDPDPNAKRRRGS